MDEDKKKRIKDDGIATNEKIAAESIDHGLNQQNTNDVVSHSKNPTSEDPYSPKLYKIVLLSSDIPIDEDAIIAEGYTTNLNVPEYVGVMKVPTKEDVESDQDLEAEEDLSRPRKRKRSRYEMLEEKKK